MNPPTHESPGWDGTIDLRASELFPPEALRESGSLSDVDLPDDRAVGVSFKVSMSRTEATRALVDLSARDFSPEHAGRAEGAREPPEPDNISCFVGPGPQLTTLAGPQR